MTRRLPLFLALAGIAAIGAILFIAAPAEASCTGICENVAPSGGFCLRCVDAGEETGALCENSGSCGCFFVQCPYALQSSVDTFVTPEDVPEFLKTEPATVEQTPVSGEGCSLTAQIFGAPVTD